MDERKSTIIRALLGTPSRPGRVFFTDGPVFLNENLFALSFLFSLSLCVQLCAIQFSSLNIWAGQIVPRVQNNHSTILKFIHSHIRNNLFGIVPNLENFKTHTVNLVNLGMTFELTNDTYSENLFTFLIIL